MAAVRATHPHVTAASVVSVGLATQRETTVLWDARTGLPYGPAVLWSDVRNSELCTRLHETLPGGQEALRAITGLPVSTYFSATKAAWLLGAHPEARAAALEGHVMFGTVDSWLVWCLTGRHATDTTSASRTLLMDLATRQWAPQVLQQLADALSEPALARLQLPVIQHSASDYGVVHAGPLAGFRLGAVMGDQQAALLGLGCVRPGGLKCTYGTGVFALLHTGTRRVASRQGLLTTVAFGDHYALEGSVACAGSLVNWLRDGLGVLPPTLAELETLVAGSHDTAGVVFVPALSGLLAPHWLPQARGTLLGLSHSSTRVHVARAALQGIAWQVVDVLEALQRDGADAPTALLADGGLAAVPSLMAAQARQAGLRVLVAREVEATALGAARAAAIGAGLRRYEEFAPAAEGCTVHEPVLSEPERVAAHAEWKRAVAKSV